MSYIPPKFRWPPPPPPKMSTNIDDVINILDGVESCETVSFFIEECWVCKRSKRDQSGSHICDACTVKGWVEKNPKQPTSFWRDLFPISFWRDLFDKPYHQIKLEDLPKV